MKRLLTALPIWIILIDMIYGLGLNIAQSRNLQQAAPSDEAVTPDIAFSSLQVLSNGGMILIIGFGLIVLLQLNRTVLRKQILSIGVFRTLGLIAVLAFSIPSLWEWFWAISSLLSGNHVLNFNNIRYLITAICLPIVAILCLMRLFGWYRLHKSEFKNSETKPDTAQADKPATRVNQDKKPTVKAK